MPRRPKLRKKHGHWYTDAGEPTYFGKVGDVPYAIAQKDFNKHVQSIRHDKDDVPKINRRISTLEVCSKHLDHCQRERSKSLYSGRKSVLGLWCNHIVKEFDGRKLYGQGKRIGTLPAMKISRDHVDQYLDERRRFPHEDTGETLGPVSCRGVVISVKRCWNWAADPIIKGGGGLLPEDHRPLQHVPRGHIPPPDLTENDLPTDKEIKGLFKWACYDTGQIRGDGGRYRARTAKEQRTGTDNPYECVEDLLRVYYATGARTSEICKLVVKDFMKRTRQVALGTHKRTLTQSNPTLRNIQLGDEAYEILQQRCHGRAMAEPIFMQGNGSPWNKDRLCERFRDIRELAGVRDIITVYSFRHLYISELLMEGVPLFKVAKMAGTSPREIERTYGHFFNADLAEAQAVLDNARLVRQKPK